MTVEALSDPFLWKPPDSWDRITTVDAHTEGESLRVILHGFPQLEGTTVRDRRRHAREKFDQLRTALMWEPRGHADMYGCILTPPDSPEADAGVVFTHNDGYSTMCGHGIIAVTRILIELGLVPTVEPETRVVLDTPAGTVRARATVRCGVVTSVAFLNVPSWAVLDLEVEVPSFGRVRYDLAFGGAFYAFVDAEDMGLSVSAGQIGRLVESIIGTTFTGRVKGTTEVGDHQAVVTEVEGRAWITGRHEFLIDPSDPLRHGFLVR